jgi:hypothetical protein
MEHTIDVSANVHGVFERARNVLIDDPASVLSERRTTVEQCPRAFHADLRVELSGGMSVHQEVLVEAKLPKSSDGILNLPLHWRATGREGLFPTFAGELKAERTRTGARLRLVGTYAVPLGWIGRFGDERLGHRAAERSLSSYLEEVAARLEAEVHRRAMQVHPDREVEHGRVGARLRTGRP